MLLHLRHLLLAHRPPQQIGFAERIAGQILGDPHDLLLVHHDPVGFLQDRLQGRAGEVDRFAAMLAVDEFRDQSGIERTGPVERQNRGDVLQRRGLEIAHDLAHAAGFELKDALEIAAGQQLVGAVVVGRQRIGVDAFTAALLHQIQRSCRSS